MIKLPVRSDSGILTNNIVTPKAGIRDILTLEMLRKVWRAPCFDLEPPGAELQVAGNGLRIYTWNCKQLPPLIYRFWLNFPALWTPIGARGQQTV